MPQWRVSHPLVAYEEALAVMHQRASDIAAGEADELIWLLEHPPLYTKGTSAKPDDLLDAARFPIYEAGRGGEYTYHGPGQRIAYAMLDLNRRGRDVRAYVQKLEAWIIGALAEFGVEGFTREGRIGVWVDISKCDEQTAKSRRKPPAPFSGSKPEWRANKNLAEKKIAALGIRVRKWVSFHGIAINVNPDLSHFSGIVPCGIRDYGVTSLAELGIDAPISEVDAALRRSFERVFE